MKKGSSRDAGRPLLFPGIGASNELLAPMRSLKLDCEASLGAIDPVIVFPNDGMLRPRREVSRLFPQTFD